MKFLVVFQLFVIIFLVPTQDTTATVTALLHLHRLLGSSSSSKSTTTRQSNSMFRHGADESSSSSLMLAVTSLTPFQSQAGEEKQSSSSSSSSLSCRWKSSAFLSMCLAGGAIALTSLLQPLPVHAATEGVTTTATNIGRDSIAPCSKLVAPDKNAKNCVSTASVRQLDLYAAPWTFAGSLTNQQVLDYLQQALREADRLVEIVTTQVDESNNDNANNALRAVTTRAALSKDQLDFYVNRDDRVIQFVSRQVEGPDVSDLGVNRKRLEEVRRKTPFGIMGVDAGEEEEQQVREGALGQLKAFYGLQSGSGFEDVYED